MHDWENLLAIVRGKRVFVQTHDYPDPDSIASAYALQQFFAIHGIPCVACYGGEIAGLTSLNMLDMLPIQLENAKDIEFKSSDSIVLVDAQKFNSNITDYTGAEVACIDHHPTFVNCEYKYKNIREVGACSTLVANYFLQSNTEISTEVATALTFGLRIDTDNFTRGVTDDDVEVLYRLNPIADKEIMTKLITNTLSLEHLKAYGEAIKNIKVADCVGFTFIPFDCNDALIGMVSDFMLSVNEVHCSIVYSLRESGLKLSIRSDLENINAGTLISQALKNVGMGGGHKTMAGGFIPVKNLEKLGRTTYNRTTNLRKRFMKQIKNITPTQK